MTHTFDTPPPLHSIARRSIVAVATLLLSGAVLVACAPAAGGSPSTEPSVSEPITGGQLRFTVDRDPLCLDPQQASATASMIITRTFVDSLTDQNLKTGELEPWLAESWDISDDATTFTFNLAADRRLQDGTPITADVIVQNFNRVVDLGARALLGSGYLRGLISVEALDEDTVRFIFDAPNAQFLQATSTQALGILAPSTLARSPEDVCAGIGVVGSGPFVLDEYVPEQSATVTAWDDYDQAPAQRGHAGRAYLDSIVFDFVTEPGVRLGLLTSDQTDAYLTVAPQDEQVLAASDYQILSHVNEGFPYHFQVNTQNPILADEAVRSALQIGFDRDQIAKTVLTPTYGVAAGALSPSHPYFLDQSKELAYDPDRAAELLDDAGWVVGSDGVRVKDGQRLSLRAVFYQGHDQVVQLIQQRYAELGIELQLRQITTAEGTEIQSSGDYDLFQSSGTRADPDILRARFLATETNAARISEDDPLNELLVAQARETDVKARRELVDKAQRILIEQGYEIPIYLYVIVVGAAPDVHGLAVDENPRNIFYDTWIG